MCLKVASALGFKCVAGIELDHTLAEIGRSNMEKLKLDAEIIEANATTFEDYKDFDVFYFYNPFGRSVFIPVIERIKFVLVDNGYMYSIIVKNPYQEWLRE